MSTHRRPSKHDRDVQDERDNKKFMIVLAIATVALMLIMYLMTR